MQRIKTFRICEFIYAINISHRNFFDKNDHLIIYTTLYIVNQDA